MSAITTEPQVRVVEYPFPDAHGERPQTMYALWCGPVPVVFANVYLRAYSHLRENSRKAMAYNLLEFVRFVLANERDFFDPTTRSTGPFIRAFRNHLSALRQKGALGDTTAAAYMAAAFGLCNWWVQPGEPPLGESKRERRRHGTLNYTDRVVVRRPPAWRLRPRKNVAHAEDRAKTLAGDQINAVWDFLMSRKPERPAVLRAKPRPDWPEAKRRAYERSERSYIYQLGLYRRDLALWGLMLAAGPRRSEVPLLMLEDVLTHTEVRVRGGDDPRHISDAEVAAGESRLWVDFRYRPETEHLGRLKGGGRLSYIGYNQRAVRALRAWLEVRPLVVARTGQDHAMLLTKDDGSPLTSTAISGIFRRLLREVAAGAKRTSFAEELLADGQHPPADYRAIVRSRRRRRSVIYPHLLRHTLITIWRGRDVPQHQIQQQVGHVRAETTAQYGTVEPEVMRTSLDRLATLTSELGATT